LCGGGGDGSGTVDQDRKGQGSEKHEISVMGNWGSLGSRFSVLFSEISVPTFGGDQVGSKDRYYISPTWSNLASHRLASGIVQGQHRCTRMVLVR